MSLVSTWRVVGYNAIAFNQVVHKKIDPKTFVNGIDLLLERLRKRSGIIYLKRLTIVLDEDSEKGFGLVRALSLLPEQSAKFYVYRQTRTFP